MRAKYDKKAGKTRAEFSDADRKAIGKSIEVLTNLNMCEKVDEEINGCCNTAIGELDCILANYPADTKPADGNP